MYGLHTPIPKGSSYKIQWDDETIEVHIPPVGYTINRIPDPQTGIVPLDIVPCEILFKDLPLEQQKWTRTRLPKEWSQWRKEERIQQKSDAAYVHPDADRFRQQEWTRRINGVWIAIGNRNNFPTEYFYLPGPYYHFLNWWRQDFGYADFRIPQWEVYLAMCWGYDHPKVHGLMLSSNRRFGKTGISMHHLFEMPSRVRAAKAGLQGQTRKDAREKFETGLIYGFLSQPDFFKPRWDTGSGLTKELSFRPPISRGKNAIEQLDDYDEKSGLWSKIDYRETKSGSYDGYKLHRYSMEEPGKWEEEDVYKTIRVVVPSTIEPPDKIGFIFAPTTIEDIDKGGKEFIEAFEDSRPSKMLSNPNGQTTSRLVSIFVPAYKGYIFDEYGRAVIDDPRPGEVLIDSKGKPIKYGAKTILLQNRESVKHDQQLYVDEVRKFPFSWDEAKMMDSANSPFNTMVLTARLSKLESMRSLPFIYGNFEWVNGEVDGDVEFVRNDHGGRWQFHYYPDKYGDYFEGDNRVTNRVGYELFEGKKVWFPKNNKMFRMGTDPIRYDKTDDPRASKAAAHVYYKFDPAKDLHKPLNEWISENFIAFYFVRPNEFEIYGEDMIKACRFFGCSVLPEANVKNLEQYFVGRGHGRFIIYRKDFDETVIERTLNDGFKGLESRDAIISAGISRKIAWINKHGHRMLFPDHVKQCINFRVKDRTKFDAVVSGYYTLLAVDAELDDPISHEDVKPEVIFPMFSADGDRSTLITDFEEIEEYDYDD